MKSEEDEAFDELARKQGSWGGGFKAKQAMAANKMQEPDEALTLEALKYAASKGYGRIVRENSAPFTIKEALAQPAQEPDWKTMPPKDAPLVQWAKEQTAPPQRPWVGLTDDEVMEMMGYDKQYGHIPQYARNFVEAISAKLKKKNT